MPTPREDRILIRVTPAERKAIEAAAKADGRSLSGWLRFVALAAAKKEGKK